MTIYAIQTIQELLHFALSHFALKKLLHFALNTLLHFASMLLHFALVLHFAAIVITFCISITFCGDYNILRRNTSLKAPAGRLELASTVN